MRQINRPDATTVLIVTHDPRLVRRCDRIIELVDGAVTSDRANTPPAIEPPHAVA